jgi:hypothetical protein
LEASLAPSRLPAFLFVTQTVPARVLFVLCACRRQARARGTVAMLGSKPGTFIYV